MREIWLKSLDAAPRAVHSTLRKRGTNDHGCCPQMRAAMGDSVVAGHLLHLSASTLDSGRRLPRAGLGACQLSDTWTIHEAKSSRLSHLATRTALSRRQAKVWNLVRLVWCEFLLWPRCGPCGKVRLCINW